MRRRFLPLAAAFSMMAAAADEQQAVAARESMPAPNGETFDGGTERAAPVQRAATPGVNRSTESAQAA